MFPDDNYINNLIKMYNLNAKIEIAIKKELNKADQEV